MSGRARCCTARRRGRCGPTRSTPMATSMLRDRRDFMKAGTTLVGGLVINFGVPLAALPMLAEGASGPFEPNAFIRVDRQNVVTLVMPMCEMGQGVYTAMAMLLAEELE